MKVIKWHVYCKTKDKQKHTEFSKKKKKKKKILSKNDFNQNPNNMSLFSLIVA